MGCDKEVVPRCCHSLAWRWILVSVLIGSALACHEDVAIATPGTIRTVTVSARAQNSTR